MRSLKWPSCWWVFRFFLTKCRKKVRKVKMMVEKVPKDHYKTMVTWRNSKKLFLDNFFEKSSEKIALTKKVWKKFTVTFTPEILSLWGWFVTMGRVPLKGNPSFYYGGGKNGGVFLTSKCKILGLECRRKFKLVLAHIMDPSGPFGARTPPKSMCTHEAHPLEKKWSKMAIFGSQWRRMCLVSANHVGRACTPGMCQARSGAEKDGIYTFLAPLELKLWLKTCGTRKWPIWPFSLRILG